jgi:hypothetical protein
MLFSFFGIHAADRFYLLLARGGGGDSGRIGAMSLRRSPR